MLQMRRELSGEQQISFRIRYNLFLKCEPWADCRELRCKRKTKEVHSLENQPIKELERIIILALVTLENEFFTENRLSEMHLSAKTL